MSKIRADIKSQKLLDKKPKESKKYQNMNFDPSPNIPIGSFSDQLPNIDPRDVQLNEFNQAELDAILGTNENIKIEENASSPCYTQLQTEFQVACGFFARI